MNVSKENFAIISSMLDKELTVQQIADRLNVSRWDVYSVIKETGKHPKVKGKTATAGLPVEVFNEIENMYTYHCDHKAIADSLGISKKQCDKAIGLIVNRRNRQYAR